MRKVTSVTRLIADKQVVGTVEYSDIDGTHYESWFYFSNDWCGPEGQSPGFWLRWRLEKKRKKMERKHARF